MNKFIYLSALLFYFSMAAQIETTNKNFLIELLIVEKKTKDTLIRTFTEIYSGNNKINVHCCSDFDGVTFSI
ncbi:hypothetical protein SAMN05444395_101746 [Flavobacterium fryxellicola]|uniref:hypothetical protein n=1 Tax=Flavobacterium fryxellicola TaxID=249352 RepID=UPI0009126D5B|nr:hypothetical protein [Flavobacterium fryxellicola]SHN55039.1 hypothetical protein SAMN05444395_101746 [Flavobacterium fryxellicola]